jgi:hypothetical protein
MADFLLLFIRKVPRRFKMLLIFQNPILKYNKLRHWYFTSATRVEKVRNYTLSLKNMIEILKIENIAKGVATSASPPDNSASAPPLQTFWGEALSEVEALPYK